MILIFQVSNTYQPKTTKTANLNFVFPTTTKGNPRKTWQFTPPKRKIMDVIFFSNNIIRSLHGWSLVQKNGCKPAPSDKNTILPEIRCFSNVFAVPWPLFHCQACESMEVTVGTPKVVRLPKPSATEFPMEEESSDNREVADGRSGWVERDERFFYGLFLLTWVVATQRFLEFSSRKLGKWSHLTSIIFRWVETTN